jgi:prolipoprotein diacylglyceryltransferase
MTLSRLAGMVSYALAFCVAVPWGLIAWAKSLDRHVRLPTGDPAIMQALGLALMAGGLLLWCSAVHALWRYGDGLPMNAFPPKRPVTRGAFAIFAHPIYVAFGMACFGAAAFWASPAGLWIVAPTAMLASVSLVQGYENAALFARFPTLVRRPYFRLAGDSNASDMPPSIRERGTAYALMLAPWALTHVATAQVLSSASERSLAETSPADAAMRWLMLGTLIVAVLLPLVFRTASQVRRFTIDGLIAGASIEFLAIMLGDLGLTVSAHHLAASLALAVVCGWSLRSMGRGLGIVALVWIIAMSAASLVNGVFPLVVAGSLGVGALSIGRAWWIERSVRAVEHCGNSWKAWRIGPVRVINHAIVAGVAAATGLLLMGSFAGDRSMGWILAAAAVGLAGAAAWGWFWVGSVGRIGAGMMRPFGYFGSVIGCSVTLALAGCWRGADVAWVLLGSLSLAAPWVQAIGRWRCLINGCCHGKPSMLPWAIRCEQPTSRIVRLSGLGGVPIHPTPVYSMLVNLLIGVLTLKVWRMGAAPNTVCAAYLVPAGLARFVEESLRGEPHTPVYAGLRLYQWCAAVMVPLGIVLSMLPCHATFDPWRLTPEAGLAAIFGGFVYAAAMGVDFPESNHPLSRLA